MEIKGTIIQVMPTVSGVGKKPWQKQDFIIETEGKFPKKVCLTLWGEELINKYDLTESMTITASIEIESREYVGKWYTNIKAWKIESEGQRRPAQQPAIQEQKWPDPGNVPSVPMKDGPTDDDLESLPF